MILPIVHIIYCSIINGTISDGLKITSVVPIHKKGTAQNLLIIDLFHQ